MDHRLVHPLPQAPQFVGRDAELGELRSWWSEGARGVIALVGLGGAGKTALAARFLDEVARPDQPTRPDRLFVWSFYLEPDVGVFLDQAYRYFMGPESAAAPAKGGGLLHLLHETLLTGERNLLVLDGLERVQREEGHRAGVFGQIEDPLLRGLLGRIAGGAGQTVALVTSRFPLADLEPLLDRGYRHLDVKGLSQAAAVDLLRRHGVHGDEASLARLVESYGAHALTLDHLGSLIGQFLGGDPSRAPEAPQLTSPQQDRQALRLARLLQAYETHLPAAELALLCRLCLLQRSVRVEQVAQVFLASPPVLHKTARELQTAIQRIPAPEWFNVHVAAELAEAVGQTICEALQQEPLAGPEDAFRQSVTRVVAETLDQHENNIEDDVEELIRLYGFAGIDAATDQRPLPGEDQQRLPQWIAQYNQLRHHPLLPYKELRPDLELAFRKKGWIKSSAGESENLTPADVMLTFRTVKRILQTFAVKHRVLCRVRQLCSLFRQKWRASGPLASLDAQELGLVLSALVGRHLVLREADQSVSVHPAVRDYFSQLTPASERGFWHHLIGEQLIRLIQQPGSRLPADPASLDLAEEAISHALAAGRTEQAWSLYTHLMGGHAHLAWKLGEMARGLRIVRSFTPCPDRAALGWYLRALGELEDAFQQHPLPYFRADIRLLQGRLPQVEREGEPSRTAIAEFLMGRTTQLPPDPLGGAVPRAQIMLYLGRPADAWLSTNPAQLYATIGWEDVRVRCLLFRAEVASRIGERSAAALALDSAAQWVLHSGSVEHLCLYHLVRSRIAINEGELQAARLALDEGLLLARQSGLWLYQVELFCMQAVLMMKDSDAVAAEHSASAAVKIASAAECQFQWGAAKAGHLLGRSLAAQDRRAEARPILEKILSLRKRIGDPRVKQTEALLRELSG
jgi:hypothetical protein